MVVYVLIREDQNDHGYVDTSVTGVFRDEKTAREQESAERHEAREAGLRVEDDECPAGQWQVSWAIEEHSLI